MFQISGRQFHDTHRFIIPDVKIFSRCVPYHLHAVPFHLPHFLSSEKLLVLQFLTLYTVYPLHAGKASTKTANPAHNTNKLSPETFLEFKQNQQRWNSSSPARLQHDCGIVSHSSISYHKKYPSLFRSRINASTSFRLPVLLHFGRTHSTSS